AATQLQGVGSIEVKGLNNGGGGRISLHVDDSSDYQGAYATEGGVNDSGNSAGAGTRLTQSAVDGTRTLVVDNGDADGTPRASTPIRAVGRHLIQSVTELGNDQWRIAVGEDHIPVDEVFNGVVPCSLGECLVQYHTVHLNTPAQLTIASSYRGQSRRFYLFNRVFRDDGSLTVDDHVAQDSEYSDQIFNLAAGDYIIAVGIREDWCGEGCFVNMSIEEAVNGVMTSSHSGDMTYAITVSSEVPAADSTWQLPGSGQGVADRYVSLDADDPDSPLYRVIDNTHETLVVESTVGLSGVVDNELIGVHVFETLAVRNGASVDFGDDRVIINDLAGSELNDGELILSDLDAETVQHFLGSGGGTLILPNAVQITDDLTMSGSSLEADSLNLTGNLTLSGGALVVNSLDLTGNLTLSDGARISVTDPNGVSVGGNITIGGTDTRIDAQSLSAANLLIDGVELTVSTISIANDITLSNGASLSVDGADGVSVEGNIAIGGTGSHMDTLSLSAANLQLDGAELTVSTVTIASDITLSNGSSVMPPATDTDNKLIFPLHVTAGGAVIIDATSALDADGKGYPSDYYSAPDFVVNSANAGCHGGQRSDDADDCTYGRFDFAQYAGNGGDYSSSTNNGYGGGIIKLQAQSLLLDGGMSARGIAGLTGGAGGSLDVNVDLLEGIGSLDVAGGNATSSYYRRRSGGGGRIVIAATDDSNFSENGSLVTQGGSYNGTDHVAGSGTAYRKLANETFGHLYIDNGDVTAAQGSTPIRAIGRHTITQVTELDDGGWEVLVDPDQLHIEHADSISPAAPIQFHAFTLAADQEVAFSLQSEGWNGHLYLLRNDGQIDDSDYVFDEYSTDAPITAHLSAGDYIVAVSRYHLRMSEIIAGENSDVWITYHYTLAIDTLGPWSPSDMATQEGIAGLSVDLDLNDPDSPLYVIQSNSDYSFIIETEDDLGDADLVGKELLGVHTFETLKVTGGAWADFGDDRVVIRDLAGSSINGGVLSAGEMDETQFEALLSTGGTIELSTNLFQVDALSLTAGQAILDSLSVAGALTVDGGAKVTVNGALTIDDVLMVADSATQLDAPTVTAGEVILDAGILVSQEVTSGSDITLRNSATLSAPDATTDPHQVFGLKLSA
ncbi:MAG: hypothetical protein PVI97_19180, partial [Candidatus Thiodiazotropha sp.]